MEWWQIKEDILKPLGGILVAPYLLVREIRQQVDLWKTRTHTPLGGKAGGTGELRALIDRLGEYKEEAPVLRRDFARESLKSFLLTRHQPWLCRQRGSFRTLSSMKAF